MARVVYCEGGYNEDEWTCNEAHGEAGAMLLQYPQNPYLPKILQQKERPDSVRRAVMARTLKHKLVLRSGGGHEFYDLAADPLELDNLYGEATYEKQQATLRECLLMWYLKTADCVPFERDPRGL